MRIRAVATVVASLALAPAAHAACPVKVSAVRGSAPLTVRFQAACVSTSYHWAFGDGTVANGRAVTHAYDGGRFMPTLTSKSGTERLEPITSVALSLVVPRKADYGERVTLHAQAEPNVPIRLGGRLFHHGALTITVTQPFLTAVAGPAVVRRAIVVKPRLDVRLTGSRTVGSRLDVVAILRPAHAGSLQARVDGRLTTEVDTTGAHTARIVVLSTPKTGWAAVSRVLQARVGAPALSLGAQGPAVVALEQRLRALHYALRDADGVFDEDDQEAVYAFQKVNGLDRTGVVEPGLWARLAAAGVPRARYPGDHVEVDKTRQVLFLVRGGKVTLVTHVSTGATGNTPVGLWHVYGKVPGWSWVLWYPSYFLRGFAIHGYPEVPPYPASHGCVRVPMWLAPALYAQIPVGTAIFIYY
jgi:peptidoglycan hydrolase-like protein with peptidoglycan-binding domain